MSLEVTAPPPATPCWTAWGQMLMPSTCQYITPHVEHSGIWSEEEMRILQDLTSRGDTFVDLGAHAGFLTLMGASCAGSEGHVVALEMNPHNAALLRDNLERLAPGTHEVHQVAAWSENGESEISLSTSNSGAACVGRWEDDDHTEFLRIPTVRLDDALGHLERLDVMKIDTEGAEGHILRGMPQLLERFRPRILMEFSPAMLQARGVSADELLRYMREDFGYCARVPGLWEDGDPPTSRLEELADASPGKLMNLVLLPPN